MKFKKRVKKIRKREKRLKKLAKLKKLADEGCVVNEKTIEIVNEKSL